MQDVFITNIHIKKVRHLENVDIKLSDTERKHLILTGKNGSGKTSLLESMMANLLHLSSIMSEPDKGVVINFTGGVRDLSKETVIHIPANHLLKVSQPTFLTPGKNANFWQTIVNYDYMQLRAVRDKDSEQVDKFQKWFDDFDNFLREIYNEPKLGRIINDSNYDVKIQVPGREPFSLNQMSDGYSALFDIVTKLLLQMDKGEGAVNFSGSGIVLIDEIETHLHVELQKRVLPFLTKLFPNVQFIVTTHSPFVITSLENAVVYDLEKCVRLEDASLYSYDEIVEGFYDVEKISAKAATDFERYKVLCEKEELTAEEKSERIELRTRLETVSPANESLFLAFKTYERRKKNG
jgi:predicted ATP-binding protein involved in virulence